MKVILLVAMSQRKKKIVLLQLPLGLIAPLNPHKAMTLIRRRRRREMMT
jgi:hypothetical protein